MVDEASFDALAETKQKEVLKTAVLAVGAVATIEMLLSPVGDKGVLSLPSHHVLYHLVTVCRACACWMNKRVLLFLTFFFLCGGLTSTHAFPCVLFVGHGGYARGS